jgi:stearoyl-CoA desaturase (delta-9 desaturase)
MKRVGVLHGGAPHATEEHIPPSQRLKIARYNELTSPYCSETAVEDEDFEYDEKDKGDTLFD